MNGNTSQKITYKTISQDQAEKALKAYNEGIDHRTRKRNLDLDDEGRVLFNDGISKEPSKLKKQIIWIFDQYGGWGLRLDPDPLAEAIAEKIINNNIIDKLATMPPLSSKVPSQIEIRELYDVFYTTFKYGKINKKRWFTAASKFYHFSRSDIFPILDRRAKAFYCVDGNDPDKYHNVIRICYYILYSNRYNRLDLSKLEAIDMTYNNSFQGRIKMLDKIAFMIN